MIIAYLYQIKTDSYSIISFKLVVHEKLNEYMTHCHMSRFHYFMFASMQSFSV